MRVLAVVVVLTALCWPARAVADPLCCGKFGQGPTLVKDFRQAGLVLLGKFTNAKLDIGGVGGTTDFVIDTTFKPHDILAGKKVIEKLPRYLPGARSSFLIFCDILKENIDAYRAVEMRPNSELIEYFKGAITLKDSPLGDRLRYAFKHLNHAEPEISMDAFSEYAQSLYKDYRDMAKRLPSETIVAWLQDPKTPSFRHGLFSLLLGECGSAKHVPVLRELLREPQKRTTSGLEGMLAAHILLEPKEGWQYLQGLLKDDKQEFAVRYASLRTVRFFWVQRPDIFSKDDLVRGITPVLDQGDMADFAIEALRNWQRWELADRVLDLWGKPSHDVPAVHHAILRFALSAPTMRARTFIEEQRRKDPELIDSLKDLLNLKGKKK